MSFPLSAADPRNLHHGTVQCLLHQPVYGFSIHPVLRTTRAEAIEKKIPGSELLHDTYLYEKADPSLIAAKYPDVIQVMNAPEQKREKLTGWRGFLANNFGILILRRQQDRAWEKHQAEYIRIHSMIDDVQLEAYPVRLYPIAEEERRMLVQSLNYMRHYSVWSLITIFLSMSFFGWLWEVGMHLVSYGEFVNRAHSTARGFRSTAQAQS